MPLLRLSACYPIFIMAFLMPEIAYCQQMSNDILVVGDIKEKAEVAEGLSSKVFIRTDGQISRFYDPVCLSVIGMSDNYAASIKKKVYELASASGVAVEKGDCESNIDVIVTRDARTLARHLPGLPSQERARELSHAGPSFLFSSVQIKSRDGDMIGRVARPIAPGSDPDLAFLQVRDASIITKSTRRDLNRVILIIEQSAVIGKTVAQLSAYIAMRTLAHADDRRISPTDNTILNLFKAGERQAATDLTDFDRGFLKALYHGPATRSGIIHGSEIIRLASEGSSGEPMTKGK